MFKEAFKKLELAETATILDQLNPLFDGAQFDPVETTIMSMDFPYYPGFQFLHVADHSSMPPLQRYAIYSSEKATVLDFTNEPIYALNKDVPIALTEDNVDDYVRFFFTYVRGRHGRFLISEGVDDLQWKEEPPPAARKAVGKMLVPIQLKSFEDGVYNLEATMMFKDSLFKSDINVKSDGSVILSNEELLVEDMPVMDDTFGQ